jgi:hypothetical protein
VNGPITVAIVDDYDVVAMGLANMFDQYSDRVVVAGSTRTRLSSTPST